MIAPATAATAAEVDVSVVLRFGRCLRASIRRGAKMESYLIISLGTNFSPMTLRSIRVRPTSCKGKIHFRAAFLHTTKP